SSSAVATRRCSKKIGATVVQLRRSMRVMHGVPHEGIFMSRRSPARTAAIAQPNRICEALRAIGLRSVLTTLLGIAGSFVATYLGQALGWYQAGWAHRCRSRGDHGPLYLGDFCAATVHNHLAEKYGRSFYDRLVNESAHEIAVVQPLGRRLRQQNGDQLL